MTDAPKRRRGRPSNAEREAEKIRATPEDEFLNEILSRPIAKRKSKLSPDAETIRVISELAKIGATQKEIAAVLGCSDRTLQNFLYSNRDAYEAWEDGIEHAKISLRRKQLSLADKNAPMAIFLGKNMLGQKDEHHNHNTISRPADEMSEQELLDIATRGSKGKTKAVVSSKPAPPAKVVH